MWMTWLWQLCLFTSPIYLLHINSVFVDCRRRPYPRLGVWAPCWIPRPPADPRLLFLPAPNSASPSPSGPPASLSSIHPPRLEGRRPCHNPPTSRRPTLNLLIITPPPPRPSCTGRDKVWESYLGVPAPALSCPRGEKRSFHHIHLRPPRLQMLRAYHQKRRTRKYVHTYAAVFITTLTTCVNIV